MARSTVDGDRFRVVIDKRWIYFALSADTPGVFYARVESLHKSSTVRYSFQQKDGPEVYAVQQRQLEHSAAGWLLFGAAVFSFLFYIVQPNWLYALVSGF